SAARWYPTSSRLSSFRSWVGLRLRGSASEGLAQIGQEVVDVLDADREPDEVGGHFERRAGRGGVGHAAGVLDERFAAAQGFRERDHPDAVARLDRGLLALGVAEGDHAAVAAHLLAG